MRYFNETASLDVRWQGDFEHFASPRLWRTHLYLRKRTAQFLRHLYKSIKLCAEKRVLSYLWDIYQFSDCYNQSQNVELVREERFGGHAIRIDVRDEKPRAALWVSGYALGRKNPFHLKQSTKWRRSSVNVMDGIRCLDGVNDLAETLNIIVNEFNFSLTRSDDKS